MLVLVLVLVIHLDTQSAAPRGTVSRSWINWINFLPTLHPRIVFLEPVPILIDTLMYIDQAFLE
jgi:hypothetical protein